MTLNVPGTILQVFPDGSSGYEVNRILQACLTYDIPKRKCRLGDLASLPSDSRPDLPVGTVEFVQERLRVLGLSLPEWNCYPEVLRPYLYRGVRRAPKSTVDAASDVFIKPARDIKAFTGFCLRSAEPSNLKEYASVPLDTPCWIVDRVEFVSELRYYVTDLQPPLVSGRYDDGEDSAPLPDEEEVYKMVHALWDELRHPFALDVGVLTSGETALVEVNDAWAIGLYEAALSPLDYYKFLRMRWDRVLCEHE